MQINRHHTLEAGSSHHQVTKSKSPDAFRDKIPTFKPKTLEQIFEETKRKKSSDKTAGERLKGEKLKQSATIGTIGKQPIAVKEQKKQPKNSLAALFAQGEHDQELESIECSNSQIEEYFAQDQMEKLIQLNQTEQSKKYQLRVFTPQCVPFSELGKEVNLFHCRDNLQFESEQIKSQSYWNGQITLATSMCEDEFESALKEEGQIPQQLEGFIDTKRYYVWCVNSQNESECLLEGVEGFEVGELMAKLIQLERSSWRKVKKETQRIRFLSVTGRDQFLAPEQSHEQILKYLKQNLTNKKFMSLIYFVEAEGACN